MRSVVNCLVRTSVQTVTKPKPWITSHLYSERTKMLERNMISHANLNGLLIREKPLKYQAYTVQVRSFFAWLNHIFNKVDTERIKDVGPDRACAEWLLRCGASVKWKGKENEMKEYNSLPVGNFRTLMVEAVDATDSAIMETGFPHFKGLEHFHKLKLKNCRYVTDDSIGPLVHITKDQLDWLELSDNGSVTDASISKLKILHKLKYLKLENLPGVDNPQQVFNGLKSDLPYCEIIFNDLRSNSQENN